MYMYVNVRTCTWTYLHMNVHGKSEEILRYMKFYTWKNHEIPRNLSKFHDTELREIPRNFRQFCTECGIDKSEKKQTEFRVNGIPWTPYSKPNIPYYPRYPPHIPYLLYLPYHTFPSYPPYLPNFILSTRLFTVYLVSLLLAVHLEAGVSRSKVILW
jgi:hypothetical protein